MHITSQKSDNVVVVNVFGNLMMETHLALKKKVRELLECGHKKILIDVSGIKHVDSAGIGTFVALLNTARSQKGDVRLAGSFEPAVLEIFRLCGLQRVITVYEDIETGIREFAN